MKKPTSTYRSLFMTKNHIAGANSHLQLASIEHVNIDASYNNDQTAPPPITGTTSQGYIMQLW